MEEQTYEGILVRMEEAFAEQAGFVPDDASDLGIRLKVLAGEIRNLYAGMEWLQRQAFPQTASGEALEMHAEERGLARREASPSYGTLLFRRTGALNYSLPIPMGTVCASEEDPSVRFVTAEESALPPNETEVAVAAVSEGTGLACNAAANTVTVMVTPPAGIETVSNTAFSGGMDLETDESLRSRLAERFAAPVNGTNRSFYAAFAESYEGIFSANALIGTDPGTVNVYVCGKNGEAGAALRQRIQQDLNAVKEANVTVSVQEAGTYAYVLWAEIRPAAGYTFAEARAECEAIVRTYCSELGVGQRLEVGRIFQRMMDSGCISSFGVDSDQTDVLPRANQRITLQMVSLSEMD